MLTFVPTPLGNLRDVTLRALDELRACDLIVAEDTRVARRLLSALDLPSKPLRSYREQNADVATAEILDAAARGHVVVVTDAGMPGISDPGSALVRAARAAGIALDVLPGPCAFVTAAVLSGFDYDELVFAGFLPRRIGERSEAFARALSTPGITAYYESPARIIDSLETLQTLAPAASVFLVRELTKKFEQQIAGTPSALLAALERPVRGEIVLIVCGSGDADASGTHTSATEGATGLESAIDEALAEGATPAQAAKALAKRGHGERADLYRKIVARVAAQRARGDAIAKTGRR
jgi:16S rRNA (cytidine1402-2'-O)-methyltransferase